jgi:hypothetical protein
VQLTWWTGWQVLQLTADTAGIADRISWAHQCEAKAVAVSKAVELLLGQHRGIETSRQGSGFQESSAAAALRNCMGVCQELLKDLQHFRKEVFSDWQVKHICDRTLWNTKASAGMFA